MADMFKKIKDCKVGDTLYCVGVDGKCNKVTIAEINFNGDTYSLRYTNNCLAAGSVTDTKTGMGMYSCVCYTTKEEALKSYDEKIMAIEYYKETLKNL